MSDHDIAHIESEGGYRKLVATEDITIGRTIVVLPQIGLKEPDRYSIEGSPGIHLDCSSSLAGAINHSCKPNSVVRHFRIISWSCITKNSEITIDYRRTENNLAAPFYCSCGHCDGEYIY